MINIDTESDNTIVKILKDGRILSYSEKDEGTGYTFKLYVYNLNNYNNCDIIFDVGEKIFSIIQMDDGRLILKLNYFLKVIEVEEKEIIILYETFMSSFNDIYKFSNNKIAAFFENEINLYSYDENEIFKDKGIKLKIEHIYDICEINENLIALINKKQNLNTLKDYFSIHDIKKDKSIYSFKIGDGELYNSMRRALGWKYIRKINRDYLIFQHLVGKQISIFLVNIKKRCKRNKIGYFS